jgi:hypothetical protein
MGRLKAPPLPADSPAEVAVRVLTGAREFVDFVVPRTKIKGRLRLVERGEASAIVAEARRFFGALGLPNDPRSLAAAGLLTEWNSEIAVRHLAVAVRDPADVSKPLAPIDEWRACDDNQIAAAWQDYQDLDERLDPMQNELAKVSENEFTQIKDAVKKKDATLLRSFGLPKLLAYMLTTAEQPAS